MVEETMKRISPIGFLALFFVITLFTRVGEASLGEAKLVSTTLAAIDRHYYDPERVDARAMLEAGLEEASRLVPELLVTFTKKQAVVNVGATTKSFPIHDVNNMIALRNTLKVILQFIDRSYQGDVDRSEIEYAVINGMLHQLDPHSDLLPPKVLNEFRVGTKGEFGGLGIVIGIREGMLAVIAPLDGTPAARAGIKPGDRIVQIDHESTINTSLTDAVEKLRGEIGSPVEIVIERTGVDHPITVNLTRALITIDSVQHTAIDADGKHLGYLRVKDFQANTDDEVRAALKGLRSERPLDGLVLDLRNNPGGLLDQAIYLTDHFLAKGTIVSTVAARDELLDRDDATARGNEPPYPLIVLINAGSASASEIVAGALKVHGRAVIMGETSFGKGSVQTVFDIAENTALKLTIAQYLAGGRDKIQLRGVIPDIELRPTTVDRDQMNILEDILPQEKDLEQHLEGTTEAAVKPLLQIPYLEPKHDEEKADEVSAKEYSKRPDVSNDITVQLAGRILATAGRPTSQEMLEAAAPIIAQAQEQGIQHVASELKKLDIDWSRGDSTGNPLLRVSSKMIDGGKTPTTLRAGEEGIVRLTATNIGTSPFWQLAGNIEANPSFLANKELIFGKLGPGETKSADIKLKIPEGTPSQELSATVNFSGKGDHIPESLALVIPIKGKEPPRFTISYHLASPGTKVKSISTGVPQKLTLEVTNRGRGSTSKDAVALLSNKSGDRLFLEHGREMIGELKPRASKKVTFTFHLDSSFTEPKAKLELTVVDPSYGTSLIKEITIDVASGKITPPPLMALTNPTIDLTAAAPLETPSDHLQLEGVVADDESVKDCFVFAAAKKIYYLSAKNHASSLPFSTSIPLEPGENVITIAARDHHDLIERHQLIIRRVVPHEEGT
ncbi:MAG: PDZ domain-containing protein [Deltaproteobacteria bacterium]|nr:PDZ domain-containing protein [Deltaproteobacteria bacterium]